MNRLVTSYLVLTFLICLGLSAGLHAAASKKGQKEPTKAPQQADAAKAETSTASAEAQEVAVEKQPQPVTTTESTAATAKQPTASADKPKPPLAGDLQPAADAAADQIDRPTEKAAALEPEPQPTAAQQGGPTATLRNNIEELKGTLKKYKKADGDKPDPARNAEVRKKVRLLLDFDHLGKLALGAHWKKASGKQRQDFLKLFRSLIEKSYLAKLDGLVADYEMQWRGEKIDSAQATVNSAVVRETADVEIEYFMKSSDKTWVVYNIVFDDLNLANNYRTQFNKIIVEKGFNELLTKMRSKLSNND